jgi:signal transduction histidine kinase
MTHLQPNETEIDRPPRLWAGIVVCVLLILLMSVLRLYTFGRVVLPVGYGMPVVVAAYFRNRKLLWITAAAFAVLAVLKFFYFHPQVQGSAMQSTSAENDWIAGAMVLLDLLLVTWIGDIWIRTTQTSTAQNKSLLQINAELAAHEAEIARQNEELQSQTEELERQSEELRVSNEELARREKMLESLLSLSRSLTVDLPVSDTKSRICQTLSDLVSHEGGTSAAILERHGDELHVSCYVGCEGGMQKERIPYRNSFASLVLDRGRTGFLEDVSLRSDLEIPQPRNGPAHRSVLAAPLRVGGRPIGTLELYTHERHSWTDEQINLIESLAAQTSISLESADLFARNDEERRRLKAVLDTVPFGVMISNADMSDVRINPAGASLRGVPADTNLVPLGLRSRYKVYRNGVQMSSEDHPLEKAVRQGLETQSEEVELVFPGGKRVQILVCAAPIRTRTGALVGGVAASADISDQKRLQVELDTRRREAEEASVRKSRFLAAVSHDIRTPANAISLLAELLQRTAASPSLAREIPEIAQDLKNSSLTLVNLVSDVLDLTRFDSGRIDLNEIDFPLGQMIQEECRQMQQLARDKGLAFDCDPPAPSLVVRTDRVKLSRILGNLLGNAIKFTDAGRVSIDGAKLADGSVQIRVRDTGSGIPPEHIERIFDEFFQLKNSGREKNNGTGLGLAICRRLAVAMGGEITVQSTVGMGTTFTVSLPPSVMVPG